MIALYIFDFVSFLVFVFPDKIFVLEKITEKLE